MGAKTIVYIDGFNFSVRRRARLRDTIDREVPAPMGRRNVATGGVPACRDATRGAVDSRCPPPIRARGRSDPAPQLTSAMITDAVYAERDMDRAREIVAKIG